MDSAAFKRIRQDFVKSSGEVWGAAIGSALAALSVLALMLLLYLFVDLLVWKGQVPSYGQLTAAKQREFADEWSARSEADRTEAARRLGLSEGQVKRVASGDAQLAITATEWEHRWRANVFLACLLYTSDAADE